MPGEEFCGGWEHDNIGNALINELRLVLVGAVEGNGSAGYTVSFEGADGLADIRREMLLRNQNALGIGLNVGGGGKGERELLRYRQRFLQTGVIIAENNYIIHKSTTFHIVLSLQHYIDSVIKPALYILLYNISG